ncbi:hypothetical protein P167DRAFT_539259 [Morchella conica CCBAS932]|uniref:T6SS Phospholipase effector Tle1-like catalytic domain-containing protein n=1 Tax=Morchella conica CCBAS932 TaxID=1392247 RepID=A0A3N4KD69_9PEZI|nr:hypothetical protein P167DRAFT_539259 [Morchella conica CCBAS932]
MIPSLPRSTSYSSDSDFLKYDGLRAHLKLQNIDFVTENDIHAKKKKKFKKYKRIVICCDGTWQRSDGAEKAPPSNVTRLSRAIKSYSKHDKVQQIVYYMRGVGTSGKLDKVLGGGTGVGLDDNIRTVYGFLAHNYHKHDEIFLIGFSRGAYTARSVCGLISAIGVLTKKGMNDFSEVWRAYTRNEYTPEKIQELWAKGEKYVIPVRKVCIKAIGCWDTVGALGVPSIEIKLPFIGKKRVTTVDTGHKQIGFHDVGLSEVVENAFHALAIDEHRGPFTPTLWKKPVGSKTNLKQVWFPGVHTNIGGGYENQEIADVTLGWMIQQLSPFLEFSRTNLIEILQNDVHDELTGLKDPMLQWAGGKIENSADNLLMWLMSGVHRSPGAYLDEEDEKQGMCTHESMHRSVSIRYRMDPSWRPAALRGWSYDEIEGRWDHLDGRSLKEDSLEAAERFLAGKWVMENMCYEKWSPNWSRWR